jgi:hypothetical protein
MPAVRSAVYLPRDVTSGNHLSRGQSASNCCRTVISHPHPSDSPYLLCCGAGAMCANRWGDLDARQKVVFGSYQPDHVQREGKARGVILRGVSRGQCNLPGGLAQARICPIGGRCTGRRDEKMLRGRQSWPRFPGVFPRVPRVRFSRVPGCALPGSWPRGLCVGSITRESATGRAPVSPRTGVKQKPKS